MSSSAPRIVGIDLGTTHTVVSYADVTDTASVHVLPIAQYVSAGEVGAESLLPSALYAPLPGEVAENFAGDSPWIVGKYARERGQRVPSRLVTSAKSWLSHDAIDRRAPILPWQAVEGTDGLRLSPVDASFRILQHVRTAYDTEFPGTRLAEQHVVLTVPASFDQVARELTVEAARRAGLSVRLLEEPQAAFYDFMRDGGEESLRALVDTGSPTALVLVCDVGGGTTDLTLIRVELTAERALRLERVAVGKHLLLGGDNMDLALAHAAEARLVEPPSRLDPARFAELVLACRTAKERLLGEDAPEAWPIRILSSGSALVGSTLSTELGRDEVERVVLDGFFPPVSHGEVPQRARTALVGFGLPYERDAAITRHLAAFFERHAPDSSIPVALLMNGGVFRSRRIVERLAEVVASWFARAPLLLSATDPELAVARGAVGYGLALQGHGLRIEGGAARGYYVGLEPDAHGRRRALCVVPRGAKEGERHHAGQRLGLVVGVPARFDLYASDTALHAPGAVVGLDQAEFDALPPITAELEAGDGSRDRVDVTIEGELTPIGTLDLACVEALEPGAPPKEAPRRYRLAFDLRARRDSIDGQRPSRRNPGAQRLEEAKNAVLRVFGKSRADAGPRDAKNLLRELERILGDRTEWSPEINRTLFDVVASEAKARKRSSDHERVFWMLAGFCLRPGYGYPLDDRRVSKIAHSFHEAVVFKDETRVWQQFWIAWRRVAGGLGEKTQTQIRDAVDPFLAPEELQRKKSKHFRPLAIDEMLATVSVLERVAVERRAELGRWILERTWTDRDPRLWAALGRIGGRVPTYASVHHVVPASTVERWLDHLLREKWNEMPSAPGAAVAMARVTGDRLRDVSVETRAEVAKRLEAIGADPEWIRAVRELVPLEDRDRAEFFGEGLPVGLRLVEDS